MTIADTTSNTVNTVDTWLKTPFTSSMSAGGWFLFFGLILAISVGWGIILKDLKGDL